MWQINKDRVFFNSPSDAKHHLQELHSGNFSDWRFPTQDELYILHDVLEKIKNNDCNFRQETPVWYATDKGEIKAGYWTTYPTCGGVDYKFVKTRKGVVQAVRP